MEEFLNTYEQHLEDPEWLSKAIVILSSHLYTHNSEMAKAELDETRTMVRYLDNERDNPNSLSKKMPVSEAERRAIADTGNRYSSMKAQGEAIIETIQSIKKRLDVLSWERKNG